jgi:hypothetical protein
MLLLPMSHVLRWLFLSAVSFGWWLQVVTFLEGVELPAINPKLASEDLGDGASSSRFGSSSNDVRPTATSAALPMLNLTQTSRRRLGLVFENKVGRQKRQAREAEEQTVVNEDSDDPDVDSITCEHCSSVEYSVANPILLCDGLSCGKGWHLNCLSTKTLKRVAQHALRTEEDWFCSERCKIYEFESILESRINQAGQKEYLVKWQGYSEPSWQPEANVPSQHAHEFEETQAV